MSNKNNKKDNAKKTDKTKAENPKVQQPTTKTTVEKPKAKPAEKPVEKPQVDASGTVTTVATEEVKKPVIQTEIPKVESLVATLKESDLMDANHAAEFLSAIERRTARMDRSKPITIKMESLMDYNMMWFAVKLSVQSYAQKQQLNMLTPADETIVQEFVDMASSLGIAIEQHLTEDKQQMSLQFKEIPEDVKQAAEAENAMQIATTSTRMKERKLLTDEEMNPKNWKTDEDAKKALTQDIQATKETPANKFLRLLGKIKVYRENTETDPVKKNLWATATLGSLTKELINIIGKKGIIVLNGLMSATTGSMRLGQTMIFAHSTIKKNMPALTDVEIVELLKTFIELTHKDPAQPIDQDLAVVNGILAPTRDTFVRMALLKPAETEKSKAEYELSWYKKACNPFYLVFKEEIGSKVTEDGTENPDFALKMANKMIEIRNMYVDKEAAFPLFTKADFDAVVGK